MFEFRTGVLRKTLSRNIANITPIVVSIVCVYLLFYTVTRAAPDRHRSVGTRRQHGDFLGLIAGYRTPSSSAQSRVSDAAVCPCANFHIRVCKGPVSNAAVCPLCQLQQLGHDHIVCGVVHSTNCGFLPQHPGKRQARVQGLGVAVPLSGRDVGHHSFIIIRGDISGILRATAAATTIYNA